MPESAELAFKAYEIEELADVYFFRPLGMVLARGARALRLTPSAVTLVGTAVGMAGGGLLYSPRFALIGFVVLVVHGILDSSDGQLARMTGQVSEFGRLLDGLGGYCTHAAIYVGIVAGALARGASTSIVGVALAAAVCNIVHAQMYDYHRTSYTKAAIKGVAATVRSSAGGVVRFYEAMARWLSGTHANVEATLAARSGSGRVSAGDRQRYRTCFYWPVRGWNLMGDNTRFYAIGVLAWLHHLDWWFAFILLPMNVACAALWLWEADADRRFLAGL